MKSKGQKMKEVKQNWETEKQVQEEVFWPQGYRQIWIFKKVDSEG